MFVGIDHGTSGIRFAGINATDKETESVKIFELLRSEAAVMQSEAIVRSIEKALGTDKIELIAMTYSMGDGFSKIKAINDVPDRGLKCEGGAGTMVGGGTKVFDAIKGSGLPAILIPGIHAGSENIDPRMRLFSHCASPEKVGVAYHIHKKGFENFVFSDVSSNTVTLCVVNGVIIGGIDACIGAPGLYQGPIDLQLIRDIDNGDLSANEAFSRAGVLSKRIAHPVETLALFVAMELSAMRVVMNAHGITDYAIFLTGSEGEKEHFAARIARLLDFKGKISRVTRYSAAIGCAEIARDVYHGEREIMGIPVEFG